MDCTCLPTCVLLLALCLVVKTVAGRVASDDEWTPDRPAEIFCVGGNCGQRMATREQLSQGLSHSPRERRQTKVVMDTQEGERRSHMLICTTGESQRTACLNGECYAINLGGYRSAYCRCPAKYEGDRCEMLSTYYFLTRSAELRKAAIIGGVVVGIIIIIIAGSIYCSYSKGKRKRKARENLDKQETDAMVSSAPIRDSQV